MLSCHLCVCIHGGGFISCVKETAVEQTEYQQAFFAILNAYQGADLFYFEWEDKGHHILAMASHGQRQTHLTLTQHEKHCLLGWVSSWISAISLFADERIFYAHHLCLPGQRHRLHVQNITGHAAAFRRLHRQALIDPLTSLGNRRCAENNLQQLLTQPCTHPYWIALLDMDNLKQINDCFGHLLGDDCIRLVADALQKQQTADMLACRLGGDEFLLFLPAQLDIDAALKEISQYLEVCSPLPFPVTVTYSYILLEKEQKGQQDLLSLLDEQLYQHKKKKQQPEIPLSKGSIWAWDALYKRIKRKSYDGHFTR